MKLSILLKDLTENPIQNDRDIAGLSQDSLTVKSGDLFIAHQEGSMDGREFIQDAIKKGASSILVEAEGDNPEILLRNAVSIVPVRNLNAKISEIAARFYQFPARSMQLVGVTGFQGRTSCSHFLAAAFAQMNIPCGVIASMQPESLIATDAITIQKQLAAFLKQGIKTVVIDVSPQSLELGKVSSIEFVASIFTNLSRDKLAQDAIEGCEAALNIKLLLERARFAVVNFDDDFGFEVVESCEVADKLFAYTISESSSQKKPNEKVAWIFAEQVRLDMTGIYANIVSPWGSGELHLPLFGRFNLSNILAVLATLCLFEVPFKTVITSLDHLKPAPGRMQILGGRAQPIVVIDSANTPDALEKILFALREHCHRKLYCVFGCVGDENRELRAKMAEMAEMYADHVVVTSDDPRQEDLLQIIADIQQGFLEPENIIIEHDRAKAIRDVIGGAVSGDCILIAGKGARKYQLIGDEKIPFNDADIVNQILSQSAP